MVLLYIIIPAVAVKASRCVVVSTLGVNEPVTLGKVVLPFFRIIIASESSPEFAPFPTTRRRSVADHAVVDVGV